MNKFFILFGESGSGKSAIAEKLQTKRLLTRKECQGHNIMVTKAISHTSRKPRKGEVDGKDYYFVTKEQMEDMYEKGMLIDFKEYNGNYYGLSKNEYRNKDFAIMEPDGIFDLILKGYDVFPIYIMTNKITREERMKKRGDSDKSIKERILLDMSHFSDERIESIKENFVINEGSISSSTNDVLYFIRKEIRAIPGYNEHILKRYLFNGYKR